MVIVALTTPALILAPSLRLTATDSESLLRALVPHYVGRDGVPLPVGRHGMGLLSLQTFILLLELGRERVRMGKPFLFAMGEPELPIPPGMQRRLISQAVSIAEQTICTTHSPRVAAYYPATSIRILDRNPVRLAAPPMLPAPLDERATNARRKLFLDDRARLVQALMYHSVLIPEGRSEFEWFRLLSDVLETGDIALAAAAATPRFRRASWAHPGRRTRHDSGQVPVVGRAVCDYADCRHWSGGCGHPEAMRPRRRRPR